MQTNCIFGSDSARFINRRFFELRGEPPDALNAEGRSWRGTAPQTQDILNSNNASLGEDATQRQEALVRAWVASWRQTRRGHAVVACHPFGCEAAL
jgi:hypothetical protein